MPSSLPLPLPLSLNAVCPAPVPASAPAPVSERRLLCPCPRLCPCPCLWMLSRAPVPVSALMTALMTAPECFSALVSAPALPPAPEYRLPCLPLPPPLLAATTASSRSHVASTPSLAHRWRRSGARSASCCRSSRHGCLACLRSCLHERYPNFRHSSTPWRRTRHASGSWASSRCA
eukprot:360042-Chlamydomonas_euryale.AAC.1